MDVTRLPGKLGTSPNGDGPMAPKRHHIQLAGKAAGSQPCCFRKASDVGPSFHILAYLGMASYPQTPHEELLETLGPSLLAKYVCRCQN